MSLYDHLSRRLTAARLPRQLDWLGWENGWAMRVKGEVVARGFSIGTMLHELQRSMDQRQEGHARPPEHDR